MKHRLKKIEDKLKPDEGKKPLWVCFGVMGFKGGVVNENYDLTCEAIDMWSHRAIQFKPYILSVALHGVNFDELFETKQSKIGDSKLSYYLENKLVVGTEEPQVNSLF